MIWSAIGIELEVVGDEHSGGQPVLDQGMTAALDAEPQAGVDLRPPPA